VKAQIHLFGQYTDSTEIIDEAIKVLAENWLFIKKNIQNMWDGIVYELTSSDYELLQHFARFYEPIEKWLKISKYDEVENVKNNLIEFIKTNPEIPSEWRDEVLDKLENWMIKIMEK
jgi:hypothetical protein